jgi:hypothetical protein
MQESELRYRIRHYPQAGDFVLKGRLTRRVITVYSDGVVEYEDQDQQQGCTSPRAWQSWTYYATLFVAGNEHTDKTVTVVPPGKREEASDGSRASDG